MTEDFNTVLEARLIELTSHLRFWCKGEGARIAPQVVQIAHAPTDAIAKMDGGVPYLSYSRTSSATRPRSRGSKIIQLNMVIEAEPVGTLKEQWIKGSVEIEALVDAIEHHIYDKPLHCGGYKLSVETEVTSDVGSKASHDRGMPDFPFFYAETNLTFVRS